MKYTIEEVDYFIDKFSRIPEEMYLTRDMGLADGPRCALGHTYNGRWGRTKESGTLVRIFAHSNVVKINNGDHPDYQQSTPKQRILAALRDAKAKLQSKEEKIQERIVYVMVDQYVRDLTKKTLLEN